MTDKPRDPERKKKKVRRSNMECDSGYLGQEELRLRALRQMGIEPPRSPSRRPSSSSTNMPSYSPAISQSASKAYLTSDVSLPEDQFFVQDRETQTDEWKSLTCVNCSASFNEDDDNLLCTDCSFWRHYKCINRQVYDGADCEGADQCTFCYAMEHKLPRQDIIMNDKVNMVDTLTGDSAQQITDPDLPKGPEDSWKYFWNLTRCHDGRNFKCGEYVYIPDNEKQVVVIWMIDYLFLDSESTPFAYVAELCFPENIMRFPNEKFYPNEIYLMTAIGSKDTAQMSYARLDCLRGPSLVALNVTEFRRYIPRCIPPAHVYIERKIYIRSGKAENYKTSQPPTKKTDYSTCTKDWALKLRTCPLDSSVHFDKKFLEIDWPSFRIKPSDLTFT